MVPLCPAGKKLRGQGFAGHKRVLKGIKQSDVGHQDDDMRFRSLIMYTAFFLGARQSHSIATDIALGSAKLPFHMKGVSPWSSWHVSFK